MATTTPNFGWPVPTSTDLVKDGATAMEALGDAIDTSMVDLKGGTTGQVLAKASSADMDFSWTSPNPGDITAVTAGTGISGGGTSGDVTITNSMATAITTKGDLVPGTGSGTFARLAAGSNGETLVADSSTSTGLRYTAGTVQANPVLNSAMQVWQRGTSVAISASTRGYTADRWETTLGSGQASTISRQLTNDTTNLPAIQYCTRFQRNSGQTGTAGIPFVNTFESINSVPFAGKTVTMSFYARKGADWSPTSSILTNYVITGTGTDQNPITASFTGANLSITQNSTLTTTWQRFTLTGTLPTNTSQIALYFAFTPTGTAGTNDYFEITGVQLDVGSVALPFRTYAATIQGELSACQRYYFRINASSAYSNMANSGYTGSTTAFNGFVQHPVTMRVAPTSIDWSGLHALDVASATITLSNPSFAAANTNNSNLAYTAVGATASRFAWLRDSGGASGYLGLSAEL
jgi:hypothetical protein